jgi:hypothetical protein
VARSLRSRHISPIELSCCKVALKLGSMSFEQKVLVENGDHDNKYCKDGNRKRSESSSFSTGQPKWYADKEIHLETSSSQCNRLAHSRQAMISDGNRADITEPLWENPHRSIRELKWTSCLGFQSLNQGHFAPTGRAAQVCGGGRGRTDPDARG